MLADEVARAERLLVQEVREAAQVFLLDFLEAGKRLEEVHLGSSKIRK